MRRPRLPDAMRQGIMPGMRKESRPYWLKRAQVRANNAWARHFTVPGFERIGPGYRIFQPWSVSVFGSPIEIGDNLHLISGRHAPVQFCVWRGENSNGLIRIGDNCLITPGVRISSASSISIGDNCMFAYGVYLTDADWHDIYDRTHTIGATAPISVGNNVWFGDSAFVGKGVSIGDNAVIAAHAVVVNDVEANSIVAGNPAREVKRLDPARELRVRAELFRVSQAEYAQWEASMDRLFTQGNSIFGWLRARLFPTTRD